MKQATGCSQKHSCKNASQTENRNLNILMWTLSCASTSQIYTTRASTFSLHLYSFSTGHFFWTCQDPSTTMWWSVTAVSQSWFTSPAHKQIAQSKSKEILKEKGRDVSAWEIIIWWGEVDGSWNNSVFCCLGDFFWKCSIFLKETTGLEILQSCKHSCKLQPRKHRSSSHFWFITSLSAWWPPHFCLPAIFVIITINILL